MSSSIEDIFQKIFGPGKMVSRKGEWEFTCPKCMESRHLHASTTKQIFTCVTAGCGYGGSIESLKRQGVLGEEIKVLAADVPEPDIDWDLVKAIFSFMNENGVIREYHRNWLQGRGIAVNSSLELSPRSMRVFSSDGVLSILREKFDVDELVHAGLMSEGPRGPYASKVIAPNRIVIPYFHPETTECIYARSRYAGTTDVHRFMAPIGIPARDMCWGWETYNPLEGYVIVTEGELKAQAAKQIGFQCVGIPGVNTGHEAFAKTCKSKKLQMVYILFDSETGINGLGFSKQELVRDRAMELQNHLIVQKIRSKVCQFPLLGQTKMDMDSFISISGDSSVDSLKKILMFGD